MRVYKGEPYERALAYTYLGLIYYRRSDWENARAAFNLALLADRSSKGDEERYRDDFALAHYLIGKTYLKLNEADNAQISFDKVRKYQADHPYADPAKIRASNFTLLVEMGCGPGKAPDAVVGSVDTIAVCAYEERAADVYVDGQLLGRAARLVDMNDQAKTSGSSSRDVAQAAKGVAVAILKQLPFVGVLGSVAELAGVNAADLRHWRLMPGEVHVLEAPVAPGLHTLEIKFLDAEGKELERFKQTFYYLPVQANRADHLYIVRSGMDRHNAVRPPEAEYLAWGRARVMAQGRGFQSGFGPDVGHPLDK
jgi:tetratricopeptide (TPR) repeat protein